MILKRLWFFVKVCIISTLRFFNEKYTYYASALSFTTLLAIVPLLLVIVFLVTIFPFFKEIISVGDSFILNNFVPSSAASIEYYFQGFIKQAARLPGVSIIFLFFTTVTLVHTIEETMNDIWNVPKRKRTNKLIAIFLSWCIFLLLPLLVGISVFSSSYLFSLTWIPGFGQVWLSNFLLSLVPILINTAVFSLIYIIIPNVRVPWLIGLSGGFIAAILFELARIGFAYYVERFAGYSMVYGAFAIIPILLLWLYICWFIILFGALFTNTLYSLRQRKAPKGKPVI